jgi:sodium transport system permease protein
MHTRKISHLSSLWTILRKEVVDNARDRRTLTTMAVSIVVFPLLMFGLIWFLDKTVKEETDLVNAPALKLPVVGAEYAPNLINWLTQNNIDVIKPPADPELSISKGEHRVILFIGADYPEAFRNGATAPLRLTHDSSITGLEKIGFNTVQGAIRAYSGQIASLRLTARGINPEAANPIQINLSDVASPQARSGQFLTMMPYLMIMFIMAGGMYLAIDTTAGEREKGSLEPLLTQPVKRHIVLLAKLGATIVFSSLTLLMVLTGLGLAFEYMPVDIISISVGIGKIATIFIACLPFVFAGCSLMVLVASFTKSYKEAQSYLGMVMLVPTLPLMSLAFMSPEPSIANMWVPALSQGMIIIETLKGETVALELIGLSMICSTILATALAWMAIKLYQRERILG